MVTTAANCELNERQSANSSSGALEARATSDRTPPQTTYRDRMCRDIKSKMSAVKLLYEQVDELNSETILGFSYLSKPSLASRFSSCRQEAVFVRHDETGEVQVRSKHCGLKWCPLCSASRQAWISGECERWFVKVPTPRLVTLTLRHTDALLADQVHDIYDYFRKFRKRKFFRSKTRGGVWFFHIKKSQTDGRWHPHLHMLVDSDFLEHKEISKLWAKITGGSKIVHIKAVTNPQNSVKHAARYSAEPCDLSKHTVIDSLEVFYALHGKRICGTWGSARMISFRPKPREDSKQWKTIGNWQTVIGLKDTDENAALIWKAYNLEKPLDKGISMYETELEIYDNFIHAPPKSFNQTFFSFAA